MPKLSKKELREQWLKDEEDKELEEEQRKEDKKKLAADKKALSEEKQNFLKQVYLTAKREYDFYTTAIINYSNWMLSADSHIRKLIALNKTFIAKANKTNNRKELFDLGRKYGTNMEAISNVREKVALWENSLNQDKKKRLHWELKMQSAKKVLKKY